jgi:hypothetical protein
MSGAYPSLKCEGCQADNELERVYCRACGVKLDRSKLPENAGRTGGPGVLPDPKEGGQKVQMGLNRRFMGVPNGVWRGIQVLMAAFVTGFLIQAFRAPAFLEMQKSQLAMQPVGSTVLQALERSKPQTLTFSEADLNSYLGGIQRVKSSSIPGVRFGRFYVHLQREMFCFELRNDVWGWPLYMGLKYRVQGADGKIRFQLMGASLGRVQLPPFFAHGIQFAFRNVFRVMDAEWRLVSKMDFIRIEEGRLVMGTKGL